MIEFFIVLGMGFVGGFWARGWYDKDKASHGEPEHPLAEYYRGPSRRPREYHAPSKERADDDW